jgi:hypothetical protein
VQVGIGNWQQVLEANKKAFAEEFVSRPRFLDAYPLEMSPAAFVAKLNANTGNALSQVEVDTLAQEYAVAGGTLAARAAVLRRVAENAEFSRREKNPAFVLMQYFGYMQRNPDDSPNTDFSGYFFWLSKLDEFGGNFVNAEMVKAFIISIEYRGRFGA